MDIVIFGIFSPLVFHYTCPPTYFSPIVTLLPLACSPSMAGMAAQLVGVQKLPPPPFTSLGPLLLTLRLFNNKALWLAPTDSC